MFLKKVNNTNKAMYEFLKGHFEYWTMNSWNGLKSIANNVKLYKLDIKGDWCKLLEILEINEYFNLNCIIETWEEEHKGYKVGFNGRSGGYLVLYNEDNNCHILANEPYDYILCSDNYEDFKRMLKEDNITLKSYKYNLVRATELVQDFDILCDDLVYECQYMLDTYEIVEEEIPTTKTIRMLREKECK